MIFICLSSSAICYRGQDEGDKTTFYFVGVSVESKALFEPARTVLSREA